MKSPSEYDLDFEDVIITTSDNLKLYGWFIKVSFIVILSLFR